MGVALFIMFAVLEIALVIWTCKKEKKKWRRDRTITRAAQVLIVIVAIVLPFGQRWRLVPVLSFLIVFLLIAALIMFMNRKKEDGDKKIGAAVISCVLSVLLLVFSLIPAFIFTGYKGLPVTGSYEVAQASAILVDESRLDPFEDDGSKREIPVHFYYPVFSEQETASFPLVVFSHGAFGYYQSNFSTYQELASNGYVVVALDHPHHAFFTHDTDGKLITVDPDFIQTAMELSANEDDNEPELRAVEENWMTLRVPDMNFAISTIVKAKGQPTLSSAWVLTDTGEEKLAEILSVTDTDRIGVMGHSMGGATSVEIGRVRSDISAVIDIDGTMLGEYISDGNGSYTVRTKAYEVPVLEFVNWSAYHEIAEKISKGTVYPNDVVMKNAKEGFAVTIRETEHMDFTDLPLLSPFLGGMFGNGSQDTEETMTIVNSLILDFYNCYLKGQGEFHVQEIY